MGKMIQNYSLQEKLGEGVYGNVYRAIHSKTMQQVAIKVVQVKKFKQIPKLEECTVNEINILSTINRDCDYIVRYIDMLKTANNFYFVYEYCNGGTLQKLMQKEGPFSEKRTLIFMRQILEAFKVLYKSNIMHRDLKPDNILLHNGSIKLADFGFCKSLSNKNDPVQTMLGSPIYMAPQVLKGQIYTIKADIWSLGTVFYQMLFGKCPYQSSTIANLISQLEHKDAVFPENIRISPIAQDFLRKMMIKDPAKRISWDQIFNEFTITDSGEIYNKREQFQLRSSLRNSPSFTLPFRNNYGSNSATVTSINSLNPQVVSPKINKSYEITSFEDKNNVLMKKKSPYKIVSNGNNFIKQEYTTSNMVSNQSVNFHSKTDRSGRLQMLLKNHYKFVQINQMIVDINTLQQRYCIYVSYLLFKTIEKEINQLHETLKKEVTNEQNIYKSDSQLHFKQFKSIVQNEFDTFKKMSEEFKLQLFEEEQENQFFNGRLEEIQSNKHKILKMYIQNLKDSDEDLRLASQIIDFLQQSILIKRDAYERMSKDHLQRQIKNKLSKF